MKEFRTHHFLEASSGLFSFLEVDGGSSCSFHAYGFCRFVLVASFSLAWMSIRSRVDVGGFDTPRNRYASCTVGRQFN